MKKYTICICDDEDSVRTKIQKCILQFSFTYDIEIETFELNSAETLLEIRTVYDILFLDIRFGSKNIGIDIAENLRARGNTSIIILITSFAAMSMDGYRAEPFRFILKPITEEKLTPLLKACLNKLNKTVSYIKITSDSITELIRTDKIICIFSKSRKRKIICDNRQTISTWQSLTELMDSLPVNNFLFVHKSYIVNLSMVETVINDSITLTNGMIVPIGLHFKDLFMQALKVNIYE